MGASYYYAGDVDLKDGVTPTQIVRAYQEHMGWGDEVPDDLTDHFTDEQPWLSFNFDDDTFSYLVDGDSTIHFGGEFDAFLKQVSEEFAARGWVSHEGDDREPFFYPPDADEVRHRYLLDEAKNFAARLDAVIIPQWVFAELSSAARAYFDDLVSGLEDGTYEEGADTVSSLQAALNY